MSITQTPGHVGIAEGPLTTAIAREYAPGLVLNEVEQRVVTVRPTATPIDTISRMVPTRRAQSMVVDYYTVDTKAGGAQIQSAELLEGQTHDGRPCYRLSTDNDRLFAPTETLLIPGSGNARDGGDLVLYVVSRLENGLKVVALNAEKDAEGFEAGEIALNSVVRMGRAASELDMQTDQFEALPVKGTNYCQIFKAQVEQSAVMCQAHKETGWEFSDQEEVAVMDMRMGMEKSFLFGSRGRLGGGPQGDETLFTQGIWGQAGATVTLPNGDLSMTELTHLMRAAFTGAAAGSTRKILVAGSGLIERLNNMPAIRSLGATDKVTRWGIDFDELTSKFGTLYVVHSEVFDACGHEADGMVIDPDYITRYVHVPFGVEHLDLKKSGIRNVDALVITEASCLVLRHPKAHLRVIG